MQLLLLIFTYLNSTSFTSFESTIHLSLYLRAKIHSIQNFDGHVGRHLDETNMYKLLGICYFHIRQLRAIRRSLTVDAAHALVRSLIHSRLDDCNSVLVGLPDYMINRLQSVLRSAARIVLQLPKRSHALERTQAELHWLAYPHRLYYKVGVILYKCLHGLAPPYLSTRLIKAWCLMSMDALI